MSLTVVSKQSLALMWAVSKQSKPFRVECLVKQKTTFAALDVSEQSVMSEQGGTD